MNKKKKMTNLCVISVTIPPLLLVDDDEPFPAPTFARKWKALGLKLETADSVAAAKRSPQRVPLPTPSLSAA